MARVIPASKPLSQSPRRRPYRTVTTTQIAAALQETLQPRGVGVLIEAQHLCMMMRGVEKQNSVMVTSSVVGQFRESTATREEFLASLGLTLTVKEDDVSAVARLAQFEHGAACHDLAAV